ncbi:nuclear transport factor 2 family protein [Arthrobacter sp. ISL-48]|uniref:YybH family protein n=1 Tax=Arthrobacter sp. ISL-48 TaxID=2819110 RepID=UPI001BEC18BB|nr:nuclear transport factor 2 family protein [Arthrobacter sp. ISL-48]MBT2531508.1 nuclear transport factor 2 family protein [Arthrobacter sp. ISL-48]
MDDVDAFLEDVMPGLTEADTALHNGDAEPRKGLWSRSDPVTLFGAAMTKIGAEEVASSFDFLAARFSNCASFEYQVIAAGVSGDLAYVVGAEHTTASIGGGPPSPFALRVTTIFRRDGGVWRIVHRHGDAFPDADIDSTRLQIDRVGHPDRTTNGGS